MTDAPSNDTKQGFLTNLPAFAKPGRKCNQVTADEYVKWMMLPMRQWRHQWDALKHHPMWPEKLTKHLMPALKMMVEVDRQLNDDMMLGVGGRNLGHNDRAISHALHDCVKEFMNHGHTHSSLEERYG